MTKAEALAILEAIDPNSEVNVDCHCARLDGEFLASELRAIAWWQENCGDDSYHSWNRPSGGQDT